MPVIGSVIAVRSASMGVAGQIDHAEVVNAQQTLLAASRRHGVPGGIHVVSVDGAAVRRRIDEGFRFIACGIDTEFLLYACRQMLGEVRR